MSLLTLIALLLFLIPLYTMWKKRKQKEQLTFIETYRFPPMLLQRVHKKHDYLTPKALQQVEQGMRDYFYICNQAQGKMVAMPSEIVDEMWHEFILFSRAYEAFCKKALGRFLHHTPTEAMPQPTLATEGIKRAWRLACAKEDIDPRKPDRLPLLFGIDGLLNIKNGFTYQLDCKSTQSGYCATDIGCSSGCGGDFDSSDSSGSDSSCGGSSCGGGCGGD